MMNRSLPAWITLVVVGVLGSMLFWKTHDPVIDPDTWWHLKVGEWVADHGTVPDTDPFSRMSRENPTKWVAYSWLYEVGLWAFGASESRRILVFLSALTFLSYLLVRFGSTVRGLFFVATAVVTLLPLTSERPWHVTICFTVYVVFIVLRLREDLPVRRVAWVPILFAVWANVHIQFVLGWGVLGLACLFPGNAKRSTILGLTAACVLAVLVNPYHVHLFGVVWEYATQAQALRLVKELQPPSWKDPAVWVVIGLLVVAFHRAVRTRDGFAILLAAAGAFFVMRMQRDLWFGVLAATAAFPGREVNKRLFPSTILVLLAVFFLDTFLPKQDLVAENAKRYPTFACHFVLESKLPGPLFNHFDWGGYLIFALPDHPVSIDGRTNLYGNERVLQNYRSLTGEPGWEDDPYLKSANLAILPADCPLTGLMRGSKEWTVAYEDDTAVVFRR